MHKVIKNGNSLPGVSQYQLADNLNELARQYEANKLNSEEPLPDLSWEGQMTEVLKQSEEILDVARAEAEKIKEEARQKGYDIGFSEGRDEGHWQAHNESAQKFKEERDAIREELETSIREFEELKKQMLEKHLEELKDLSIAVAEKVMRVSLQSSGDIIKRMIVGATEKLSRTQWAKIYISKYDAELMVEGDAKLLNSLSFLSDNIKIITMEHEEQGTCIIELPKEIIDASINTQMENIKGILSNVQL